MKNESFTQDEKVLFSRMAGLPSQDVPGHLNRIILDAAKKQLEKRSRQRKIRFGLWATGAAAALLLVLPLILPEKQYQPASLLCAEWVDTVIPPELDILTLSPVSYDDPVTGTLETLSMN